MAIAHEKLYQTENLAVVNVDEYTKTLVDQLFGYHRTWRHESLSGRKLREFH